MKKPYKVFLVEQIDEAGVKLLREYCDVKVASGFSEEILLNEAGDADVIVIRSAGRLTVKVINNAPRLKVIARHGVGIDNVDLESATKRGIPVVFAPDAASESVADHTFGLIIAVMRKIPQANYALKFQGKWEVRHEYTGIDIWGKTLGIIGLGRIGLRVAKRAKGFDMKVLAHDPYVLREHAAEVGAELVDMDKLLRESDIVTIHTPLTESTKGLIGEKEFKLMKKTAFLINAARGPIVKEKALYRALNEGWIAGAALDVFEQEPPDPANLLFNLEKVVVTPHMASFTREALRRMAITVAEDVLKVLRGEMPKFIANPSVLKR